MAKKFIINKMYFIYYCCHKQKWYYLFYIQDATIDTDGQVRQMFFAYLLKKKTSFSVTLMKGRVKR